MTIEDEAPTRNRKQLAAELVAVTRTATWINRALWGIAAGVMAYGAGYVTELLLAHGAPPETAWLLSFMVDLGLCIGLLADRILYRHGRRGWQLSGLRWVCAAMTWALQVAGAVWPTHGGAVDWVGVGVRSCGPILLVVVSEAAAWAQQHLAEIAADLAARLDTAHTANRNRTATAERPKPDRTPTDPPATEPQPQTRASAERRARADVLTDMVAAARNDPASLPTAADLAAQCGYSTRWADGVLAEARREARKPHLVEATP